MRVRLAEELENEQDWMQAAKVLAQIPLDSGQKQYTKETKMEMYMKIGRLFLEAEEFVEAETYIHRMGLLIDASTTEEFRIQHSAAFARIQDFKRKYIEAAQVKWVVFLYAAVAAFVSRRNSGTMPFHTTNKASEIWITSVTKSSAFHS